MMKRWILSVAVLLALSGIAYCAFAWEANLSWQPNTEADLNKYTLKRLPVHPCPTTNVAAAFAQATVRDLPKTSTSTPDSIPDNVAGACWGLTASDVTGNESGLSNLVSKAKPTPPVGLGLAQNFRFDNGVLRWDAATGAVSYYLRVHKEGTPYDCPTMTVCMPDSAPFAGTEFSIAALIEPNTKYDAWIHSRSASGQITAESAGIVFTTPAAADTVAPASPTELTVTTE